jgi:enoyl-[acyl-carrier protein] reductase I
MSRDASFKEFFMQPLFADKRGLVTGVFNKQSIAWAIADQILSGGGECGFSYMPDKPDDERKKNLGRVSKLTDGNPQVKFLQPMDVTNDEHIAELMNVSQDKLGRLDFLLHSIAFALPDDLKSDTIETSRAGFKLAMEISVYSLIALANAARPLLKEGASVLTLTYFGGERAVPGYNVMGICKAALDSTVKYLAYDLGAVGVRVNALSPGPLQTVSGRGAGVDEMLGLYESVAPLGRNVTHEEAGQCGAFLLSGMSSGITGEIMHLDGGYNMMGSPGRMLDKIKAAKSAG